MTTGAWRRQAGRPSWGIPLDTAPARLYATKRMSFAAAFALAPDSAALVSRAQPAWLWTLEGTVVVVLGLTFLALMGALVAVLLRVSKTFGQLTASLDRFRDQLTPVTDRAAAIAGHLEGAAASVHEAVDEVTDTIHSANESLRDALATADARFHEIDAIVRLARDEAADVVVGAASTARGVRGGFSAFRDRAPREADDDAAPGPPRRSGGPRLRHHRGGDTE